jgi:hypothetical protein
MDKIPCMHVECSKDAVYIVEFIDGTATYACEEHLVNTKGLSEEIKEISLAEGEE